MAALVPPKSRRGRKARATVLLLTTLVVASACNVDAPTEPLVEPDPGPALPDGPVGQTQTGGEIFSNRARVLEPEHFDLVSTAADFDAGVYRYRSSDGSPLPDVERDDFVLGAPEAGAEPFVRLALRSETVGDELVVETGGARWSDVIQTGVYGMTMPLGGDGPARTFNGVTLQPIAIGPLEGVPFGPLEAPIPDLDLCALVTDLVGTVLSDPQVCGKPRDIDVAVGVVGLNLEGTVDSLLILDGKIGLEGDMDIGMRVDGGGITGGRAPVFAPCDRAAYLGCISTPTGANLLDWLHRYAPSIPDLSLPAIRMCVPGTPVRVRRGYWDWSGWVPVWIPPAFERCRITDVGVLPTYVLPTVETVDQSIRPHFTGEMLIRVKGDGKLTVKVPIPYLGATAGYGGNHLAAKASVGVFVKLQFALKNGGGTVKVTFNEKGEVTQTWTETDGWDGDYEKIDRSVNGQLVYFDNPDSMTVRAGGLATVGVELCAALISCDPSKDTTSSFFATPPGFYFETGVAPTPPAPVGGLTELAVKVGAGAEFFYGAEVNWSRSQVAPADPLIDNHHYDVDWVTELGLKAGLQVPLVGWALPDAIKSWDWTYEVNRFGVMDLWGTGSLRVVANTTGSAPDADGYDVVVSRYDTLPTIIDPDAERLGRERDWGSVLSQSLGVVDSVEFSQPGPCGVYYTDALLFLSGGLVVQAIDGLTAVGDYVPKWAVTSRCDLLIARYNVELTGVAANCSVVGGALRDDVWLLQVNHSLNRPDGLQRVEFTVDCPAGGQLGDVEVTTTTTGLPPDDPYRITIDGVPADPIGASETRLVTGLTEGGHDIGLANVPATCTTSPVAVTVTAGGSVAAALSVTCPLQGGDPGDVTVTSATTGPGSAANGFEVRVDGIARAPLPLNGAAYVHGVPASVPTVVQVSSLAANCRATTPNPAVVTLDVMASPTTVAFTAECTTAVVDTIDGTVEARGWPTPAVTVRTPDGITTDLRGVVLDEIAQLTGTPVRVWGVRSGTTLVVYGYDLDSTLGDPRWLGVVAERSGEYWLFGDEAVHLVEPPSSLTARVGDLVWVSGAELDMGIQPFVFGVLREDQP